MLFLKYLNGDWETPRKLSARFKEIYGSKFVDLTETSVNRAFSSSDVLIRYGTSSDSNLDREILRAGGKVLNTAEAISNNCNKPRIFDILKRMGMQTPKLWRNKREITSFPVFGRNTSHQAGSDIIVIEGDRNLRNVDFNRIPDKDYYLEFIPTEAEFRVYFYRGEIFKVFKKQFTGISAKTNEQVQKQDFIRNDEYGWHFRTIEDPENNVRNFAAIKEGTKNLSREMKLDFGSFDLSRKSNGEILFWEANSASWCGNETMEAFINCVKQDLSAIMNNVNSISIWDRISIFVDRSF